MWKGTGALRHHLNTLFFIWCSSNPPYYHLKSSQSSQRVCSIRRGIFSWFVSPFSAREQTDGLHCAGQGMCPSWNCEQCLPAFLLVRWNRWWQRGRMWTIHWNNLNCQAVPVQQAVYAPFKQIESSLPMIESLGIAFPCEFCWPDRALQSISCSILEAVNAPKAGEISHKLTKKSITILLSGSFCPRGTCGQISDEMNRISKNVMASVWSPRTHCSYQEAPAPQGKAVNPK